MRRAWLGALSVCLGALAWVAPAGAVTITEFPIAPGSPAGTHEPRYIHVGPGGDVWFADGGTTSGIGRISTTGQLRPPIPDVPAPSALRPVDLVTAPDGSVFWTADFGVGLGRPDGSRTYIRPPVATYAIALTATGGVRYTSQFTGQGGNIGAVCAAVSAPVFDLVACPARAGQTRLTGLALGSDGRLWAAGYEENVVRRLDGDALTFDLALGLPAGSGPARLALGPDGNLWVTMFDASAIDRITPAGVRTRFVLPAGRGPNDIVAGPDGALWFTEYYGNRIGRMTTSGVLTNEFAIPSPDTRPLGITAGPDGALWFTEPRVGAIARLRLDPPSGGGGGGSGGGGSGGGGAGVVSDRVPPRFVKAPAFRPREFLVGLGATARSARTPTAPRATAGTRRGSTLRYSLSEPAAVTITFARPTRGRKVGKTCRRPSRSNQSGRRCTRYVTVGTLRRGGLQGPNAVAFSGRIGRRALRPGPYRATVAAKDAAGNAATPSRAAFTIATT